MTEFNFNQTIEYIDGTRDLNFEAAQRWAQEHGTSFEEDFSKREPYEQEHEETYINPTTGADEVRLVKTPTLKRFWVIGDEPKPYVPTEDELKAQVRSVRNQYLEQTDKVMLVDYPITDDERELYKKYREYLRTYPECQDWYKANPKTYDEWHASYLEADKLQTELTVAHQPTEA